MLPLSVQYLPSSHRLAFLFCPASLAHGTGTLYCTFTLKEKDTQFLVTKLEDSTINPAATVLPSPFALLSSSRKGCALPWLLRGRHPVISPACSPSSLVPRLLLVPGYSDAQLGRVSNIRGVRNGLFHRHCSANGPVRRNWESLQTRLHHAAPQGKPRVPGSSHDFWSPDDGCQGT